MSTRTSTWNIYPAQLGMWFFLGTVTMLFAAFTSAYIIRRAAADWVQISLPAVLWANTVILVISSLVLESARSSLDEKPHPAAARWLGVTILLGLFFVAGQLAGWRELVQQGVFVPTSPHSSFFYILTGLHGIHVLGGLAFLSAVTIKVGAGGDLSHLKRLVRLCATYWHFLLSLWIFVFLVLGWL
ncbi:MAG: cytochrome-c oxidase [bacterium]|nr:cytochrome-c oxidase [bacterium]